MELVDLYLNKVQTTNKKFVDKYGENVGFLTPIDFTGEKKEEYPFYFSSFELTTRREATPMFLVGNESPLSFERNRAPEYRFQIQMEADKFDNLNKIKDIIDLHDTFKIEIKGIEADVKIEKYYSNYYARDNISPSIVLEMISTGEVALKMDNSY